MIFTFSNQFPLEKIIEVMQYFPKLFPGPDEYVAAILLGSYGHLYYCSSSRGHQEVLESCVSQYSAMNGALPAEARLWILGPCKESGCSCGGERYRNLIYNQTMLKTAPAKAQLS